VERDWDVDVKEEHNTEQELQAVQTRAGDREQKAAAVTEFHAREGAVNVLVDSTSRSGGTRALKNILTEYRIGNLYSQLSALGAHFPDDLVDMDAESIGKLQAKPLEIVRLNRLLAKLNTVFGTEEGVLAKLDSSVGTRRAAVVIKGQAFRAHGGGHEYLELNEVKRGCTPASYWRQKGITNNHIKMAIEPFVRQGLLVDVFLVFYQAKGCPTDIDWEGDLVEWYSNTSQPGVKVQSLVVDREKSRSQVSTLNMGMDMVQKEIEANSGSVDAYYGSLSIMRFDLVMMTPWLLLCEAAASLGFGLFSSHSDFILWMHGGKITAMTNWWKGWERASGNIPLPITKRDGMYYHAPILSNLDQPYYVKNLHEDVIRSHNLTAATKQIMVLYESMKLYEELAAPCWAGRMAYTVDRQTKTSLLENTCTGKIQDAKQLRPGGFLNVQLYRNGDCAGLRSSPATNEEGGTSEEEFKRIKQDVEDFVELHHGWRDRPIVPCTYAPQGCLCTVMVHSFGMSPKGCGC
jgi:hypothetical protein